MTIQLRHSFEPVRVREREVDPPRSLIWRFRTPRKVREARARREWETGRDGSYAPLHRGRSRWDRLLRRRQR